MIFLNETSTKLPSLFLMNNYSKSFALLLSIVFFCTTVYAESNQKKQNQLKQKITTASTSLKDSRAISSKLKKYVRVTEDKLNTISRELYKTEKEMKRLRKTLKKSNKQKKELLSNTVEQKAALAQQLQALYTSGKQSHLRLLLKQDDPSDISRTTKYFEYMNRHRLKRIRSINKKIKNVKRVEEQINKDTKRLRELQKKQKVKKKKLKSTVKDKERAYKKQRRVVYSRQQKLTKLVRQESHLKGVIESLARKQKKQANERKAAKKRANLLAKNKKNARKNAKKTKQAQAKSKKKISKNKTKAKKKRVQVQTHFVPNKPFSSLRGKLSWPVKGTLLHRYGSVRNTKQRWKAVVISARGGTRVRAVARGKVEYSGRLKGYGYVIIIRHDKNYRSIYGYNRSVYKREGQIVKAGDTIAAVGNSGGLSRTGLYFEIRKSTRHQNPARWCR